MEDSKSVSHEDRKFVSHSKIFGYWKDKSISASGRVYKTSAASTNAIDVVVDWHEPECWACREFIDKIYDLKTYDQMTDAQIWNSSVVRNKLNRCHIVPHALGGSDTDPSNYFLLCKKCHEESPDTSDRKIFLRWVYKKRSNANMLGRDLTALVNNILTECDEQNKDPFSFDIEKSVKVISQGQKISDSTLVYSFVSGCNGKSNRRKKSVSQF